MVRAAGEARTLFQALERMFAELEAQAAGPGLTDWACLGIGCARDVTLGNTDVGRMYSKVDVFFKAVEWA